jgi:hypothetical protein
MKKILLLIILLVLIVASFIVYKNYFIKKRNCPEWINCMPGLSWDEATGKFESNLNKKCEIPKGCENITEIVR